MRRTNLYAAGTNVSADSSRLEIERILKRYGADQFAYGWRQEAIIIQFRYQRWIVRFVLPIVDRDEFSLTPTGRKRHSRRLIHEAYEQDVKARWRSLALRIKSKLDAVERGIAEFEHEFIAELLLPNGQTVADWLRPQLDAAYEHGVMPNDLGRLLPPPRKDDKE